MFFKICERFLHENLTNYVNTFLSKFVSAYRKSYTTNHVLIRLTENWKKSLDQKKFVGAVLMDLSKAFDAIPYDLLIAKMCTYGFSINAEKIQERALRLLHNDFASVYSELLKK